MLLLLFPASWLAGQEFAENKFDHYTTATGISDNTIIGVKQDATGYIWISTTSGLNRFNGSRFVQFHSNNDSNSLPSEVISGMTWLDTNRLAVFAAGLHIVNTATGETRNLFIPYHDLQFQFKFNMIERALGDERGNIFILSRSGFYHYDKNYTLVSRFDYYTDEEVPLTHFVFGRDLLELDATRLLITSTGGFYIYDKEKRKIKKMDSADCPHLHEIKDYPDIHYLFFQLKPGNILIVKPGSDSLVYINTSENKKVVSKLPFKPDRLEFHYRTRVIPESDTTFYITGHMSGFYRFRFFPETGAVTFYPEKYFKTYQCNTLFADRDKHLWIATNKGLFRQNPQRSLVQRADIPAHIVDSFPEIRIDDVAVTAGKVYAGTRAYGGLLVYDKKTFRFVQQVLFQKYKPAGNTIYALAVVDSSSVMLGTAEPLLLLDQASGKETRLAPPEWHKSFWTGDLFKDRKGNIWIGSYNIYRYAPGAKKFTLIPNHQRLLRVPFAIQEDTSGHIWMVGHGLARYNTVLDSIDLVLDSFPYIKMPDKQVNSLVVDTQNTIWFNSNNNGLISYNIGTRMFRHYTRADGLPDDNIASMIIVGHHLWIACFSGIACMDLRTSKIIGFGKEDGFPGLPVVKGARFFYDNTLKQLYLAFSTVIVRFNPDDILQKKSPPHMFIESLLINNQKNNFLPGENITTSWQNNEIRITIGTINFSDGASQRFAYRVMKKNDTSWIQMGSQSSFSISSLSPGTYRIQVKCFSPSNRWADQVREMSIVVFPPFWKEGWFMILMGAIAFVLIYLLIRWRTGLVRKKEMQKTHLEKLKADDYKNQFELEQISNYFSSSLVGKKTVDEVLWDVTNNLIGRMNYVDCMIYLWNDDKTKMIQKAAYGPKGKPEFISAQVFDVLPGQGIVGYVMETRQPILVKDTRTESRYRVDEEFRLSEVCVPIIHNDELMGIIDSEHYLPNYFTERDIKILTTIATLIGNKLKQLESEQSLDAKRKELATINEQLAEARLAALQAQMNPHFVFNALNSIKRMILDGDNDTASRYLSKFALMIRMTLNHSKEIFVMLDENVEYLRTYLEMEQLRFDDSFTYIICTDRYLDASETPVPSMMIQPLVENAIWHGLLQSEKDKKIMISFCQHKNRITCTVEDNGIGIRQAEKLKEKNKPTHQSVGLENLQKRIKIMNEKYDMDCRLLIIDLGENEKNGSGTRVILEFNLINV